jgi:hypothetical protein
MLVIVGSSIFSILSQELVIADVGDLSEIAYYAAESGMECGLFGVFDGRFQSGVSDIDCDGNTISIDNSASVVNFSVVFTNNSCATVSVDKTNRLIKSRGYNSCSGASAIHVERGLQASY